MTILKLLQTNAGQSHRLAQNSQMPGVCRRRGVMLKFRFDRGINVRPHEEKFLITGTPSPPNLHTNKRNHNGKKHSRTILRHKGAKAKVEVFINIFWRAVVVRALTSQKCGPDSISRLGVTCGLNFSVLFSALRGFPPGTTVFPSPQKPACDKI